MSDDDDPCASSIVSGYDEGYHIGAVFIILAASLIGTAIPILSKRVPAILKYPFVFVVGKHMGTGVLIALGLIHLLAPAFGELGNPCLPADFSTEYEYAPLFAMLAALIMHLIEMIAQQVAQSHYESKEDSSGSASNGPDELTYGSTASNNQNPASPSKQSTGVELGSPKQYPNGSIEKVSVLAEAKGNGNVSSSSSDEENPTIVIETPTKAVDAGNHKPSHSHAGHTHGILLETDMERTIGAYILEFGLTAHSVIIGITVGVASASELNTLVPALVFHQFFEGFALGARLAEIGFNGWNEGILTLIYSCSAPLGIAVGIGIQGTYNGNGQTTLLVQGTFDAISAGIILYVAFVQMLAIEFTRDWKETGKGPEGRFKKTVMLLGMYVGATVMAVIGKYL